MFSQATADGVMNLTITFKLGTDVDKAQVQVQNRVSQALPKLPEEVRNLGVTTTKQSPDLTMVVHLFSPDGRYDDVYLRNYATLQVKDVLARIPGRRQCAGVRLGRLRHAHLAEPDKIAARNLTASDVVAAIREQNVQVAAGAIGQQPVKEPVDFELQINAKGRLISPEEFGQIIVKVGPDGEKTLLKDVARMELSADDLLASLAVEQQDCRGRAHLPASRRQCAPVVNGRPPDDGGIEKEFPGGHGLFGRL